jgi:hypothetical protein
LETIWKLLWPLYGTRTSLQVVAFEPNSIAVSKDGTGAHTHQISNFKPIRIDSSKVRANYTKSGTGCNILTQDGDAYILGTVDVGMNGQKMWDNVNANIIISKGLTIEIVLDERDIDYHLGKGQSIFGLVNTRSLS